MTLLAIVAIHTAANEPLKVRQVMNKIHRNVGAPAGGLRGAALPHALALRAHASGGAGRVARRAARLLRGGERRVRGYVAMNFVHHLTNFRRLVCGCMDSYDSEPSHILQHF